MYNIDGAHQMWVFMERVERVRSERAGREYVPTAPEPDEAQMVCWTCDGTGEVTEGALAQHESRMRAFEAGDIPDVVGERIEAIKRSFWPDGRVPDSDDDDVPPTLRSVDD